MDKILAKWQNILSLNDWKVEIRRSTQKQIEECVDKKVMACIVYELFEQKATIHILNTVGEDKLENCIIHELLHLVFAHETRHYQTILEEICSPELSNILTSLRTDAVERILHQITNALLP